MEPAVVVGRLAPPAPSQPLEEGDVGQLDLGQHLAPAGQRGRADGEPDQRPAQAVLAEWGLISTLGIYQRGEDAGSGSV